MKRTPLPPMSKERREEFAAAGIPHPTSTFKPSRKASKAKRPKATGPDRNTVEVVLERDHWSCVVCGEPLHGDRGINWSIHHRVRRSQGVDNLPSNLIAVCGHGTAGCHSNIHAAPAKAREAGWLLRSTDIPAEVPMAHSQHGWVRLAADGEWTRSEEGA